MSEELSDLEAQLAESVRLQTELQSKIKSVNEKILAASIITIKVESLKSNYVYISNNPPREDALNIFRSVKGRIYKSTEKANAIPVGEFGTAITLLTALPKAIVEYAEGVKEKIDELLYEPDFKCDITDKYFTIKSTQRAYTYNLRQLPGYDYDYAHSIHKVPLTEGWRLFEYSKTQNSFIWSDAAKEFVIRQVENRLKLDEIAKAEDVELEIPELKAKLKNFQKVGIKYFDLNGVRGILADEMGTGKTLQMIGLVLLKKYKALIVCPAALKENWLREIRKFAPQCSTMTLQGEVPHRLDLIKLISATPDFTIVNYDILGRGIETKKKVGEFAINTEYRYPWVESLNLVPFDIIICDEAHYIKNTDSNRSKAVMKLDTKHAIMMTGTPILNRPGELWPMLHVADPITFPSYELFKKQYTFDGKIVNNVEDLKTALRPLMIRRLKKDVIKELEPINRINSYFELSERGRKLYDKVLAGVFEILKEWNPNQAGAEKDTTHILAQIQRLKQVVAIDAVESTADLATEIYDSSPEEGSPSKVLIFSQFKATTYAISKRLGSEALSFVNYTGSGISGFVTGDHQWQQACIDQFQNDPKIHFLCVTEKTAKEGHNITAAHAVIFNDLFWTPAGHQQAEARAYGRISDLHTIDSYYRIGVNSISEKIMDILAAKLAIIEQVVEGVEASRADVSIVHELLSSLKEELWTFKKKEK